MTLFTNVPLLAAIAASFLAQAVKVALLLATERRWAPERLLETGGMPSSHSAAVAGLATAIGQTRQCTPTHQLALHGRLRRRGGGRLRLLRPAGALRPAASDEAAAGPVQVPQRDILEFGVRARQTAEDSVEPDGGHDVIGGGRLGRRRPRCAVQQGP